jgi:hypothetical protein
MSGDAITELERLLREEREAIRRLDAASVLTFAERKEALVRALHQGGPKLSEESAARLRALAPALRHNSVLLAHARDVLRDALVATRGGLAPAAPTSAARPAEAAPRILSVRG